MLGPDTKAPSGTVADRSIVAFFPGDGKESVAGIVQIDPLFPPEYGNENRYTVVD